MIYKSLFDFPLFPSPKARQRFRFGGQGREENQYRPLGLGQNIDFRSYCSSLLIIPIVK